MASSPFTYTGVAGNEDVAAFGDVLAECFPMSFTPEVRKEWPWAENPDHFRLLRCAGRVAAGLVAVPVGQWFGGRPVSMWAVRLVGVGLEFRSLGAAPLLMADMLREARRDGVAVSSLYPATQPLYRSVGYEQAGFNQLLSMPVRAARLRDHALELRRMHGEQGVESLDAVYREQARRSNGHVDRTQWFWDRVMKPRALPETVVFEAIGDAGSEGYMVYAMPAAEKGAIGYDVQLTDFVPLSATAARRMVAHLGEHHSLGHRVRWRGPVEAAPFLSLPQQNIRVERNMLWMLRVVDVKKALEQRGYAPQVRGQLQFEIHDALLPENAGRWTLQVEDGTAHVEPGGSGALQLDIRGLAPLFAGHLTPDEVSLTGLAQGTDAAMSMAAHLFAGPRSWMSDFF